MLLSQKSFSEDLLELLDESFLGFEQTDQGANTVVMLRSLIF